MLRQDRFFDTQPEIKEAALSLFSTIEQLPILSPHTHLNPAIFSIPDYHFPNPVKLLVQSDHYILRMLHSQGIPYDTLLAEDSPEAVWQVFADQFHLFNATPSGLWLNHALSEIFGIPEALNHHNGAAIYQAIQAALSSPEFTPKQLFKRFNIEALATTDNASDDLRHLQALRASGWDGKIIPTFRADLLIYLQAEGWQQGIDNLSQVSGMEISSYKAYILALQHQREFFKSLGATAADISVLSIHTEELPTTEAESIFQRALKGKVDPSDNARFIAHMLMVMAEMSADDGLVMQVHAGIYRNHHPGLYKQFGADMGFDIPVKVEFTQNLQPLMAKFGNHPNFNLILFTLDESTYARELAPLAGVYPALKLGPPWWFNDSWNGMQRFFDQVIDTAGIYNTAGFNDDARTLVTIPAKHDLWRRIAANWAARLMVRGFISRNDAEVMVKALAYGLAKNAYKL